MRWTTRNLKRWRQQFQEKPKREEAEFHANLKEQRKNLAEDVEAKLKAVEHSSQMVVTASEAKHITRAERDQAAKRLEKACGEAADVDFCGAGTSDVPPANQWLGIRRPLDNFYHHLEKEGCKGTPRIQLLGRCDQ